MPLAAFPKCYLTDLMEGDMTVTDWLDVARRVGLDGVEFYWGITPDPDTDAEELGRLRRELDARDLAAPMMCYSPDFTRPQPEARAEEVDAEKRAIRATAGLGGSYCRVLSGQ
jgi:sugar phosphate isomerase/epimerase